MKITIDISCSPEEARSFFGLPDVGKMQEAMLLEMQKKMASLIETADAETLWKLWFPTALKNMENFQKAFFDQMMAMQPRDPNKKP